MFILLYIGIVIAIYIATFKDEFSEEHLAKITPVIIAILAILTVIVLLGLAGWGAK